jgi:hypothetical protein
MRTRSLVAVIAAAALLGPVGCVHNPDPRELTLDQVVSSGLGGWIVVHTTQGDLRGELIAMTPADLTMLARTPEPRLTTVPRVEVTRAELYPYHSEAGAFGMWGAIGALSTISHGFGLILSAPVWLLTTAISGRIESGHANVSYPDDDWANLRPWARFPQGLPPDVGEEELLFNSPTSLAAARAAAAAAADRCDVARFEVAKIRGRRPRRAEALIARDPNIAACLKPAAPPVDNPPPPADGATPPADGTTPAAPATPAPTATPATPANPPAPPPPRTPPLTPS